MSDTLIKISDGNSKLGAIPNVSLVPGRDCGNCSHCVKDCYAVKFWKNYPSVRNAWDTNSKLAHDDLRGYFQQVCDYLDKHSPRFFRWHVAGDILSQEYLDYMYAIARAYPKVAFLAFTKMHHLKFGRIPKNLSIVASMWTGMEISPNVARLPKAWMQDDKETRVPADAIACPGHCETCGMCWALPQIGRDVVFHKH